MPAAVYAKFNEFLVHGVPAKLLILGVKPNKRSLKSTTNSIPPHTQIIHHTGFSVPIVGGRRIRVVLYPQLCQALRP
jgi:hypothetical protein